MNCTGAGTALSTWSSRSSEAPLLLGRVLSLCLEGTGLEGCWLTWCLSQTDLAQSKGDEGFPLS